MRQLLYAMQFRGQAAPDNAAGTVMTANTRADSFAITSTVTSAGLASQIGSASGEPATFKSEVSFTGDSSFLESGWITFGEGNTLRFSTVGKCYLSSCADPKLKHGCVSWKVDGGDGQLAGATGLITSNFFVSDTGEVTDNQFGVIFIE